jgi:hypothetical protein
METEYAASSNVLGGTWTERTCRWREVPVPWRRKVRWRGEMASHPSS